MSEHYEATHSETKVWFTILWCLMSECLVTIHMVNHCHIPRTDAGAQKIVW